jgi:dipeptidyl aminopeptidase/acylaminoacyl peptidase
MAKDNITLRVQWFPNSSALLLTAPSCGRDQLFTLPVSLDSFIESRSNPFPLSLPHSSSAPQLISTPNSKSLSITYTSSSLASPPETFLFDLSSPHSKPHQITNFTTTSSILSHHKPALSQGEEIYFDGADGVRIQGWVVKPPGFEKGGKAKEWPMAFLIHGGPQGAWEDSWSWRWNPNVFAQQGYVVVAINPTGSTSFGQKLTDDIQNNWGGRSVSLFN